MMEHALEVSVRRALDVPMQRFSGEVAKVVMAPQGSVDVPAPLFGRGCGGETGPTRERRASFWKSCFEQAETYRGFSCASVFEETFIQTTELQVLHQVCVVVLLRHVSTTPPSQSTMKTKLTSPEFSGSHRRRLPKHWVERQDDSRRKEAH